MSGISIGVETNCVRDIKDTIQIAKSNSQDFIVVPLVVLIYCHTTILLL
jgi:hypothetical protein